MTWNLPWAKPAMPITPKPNEPTREQQLTQMQVALHLRGIATGSTRTHGLGGLTIPAYPPEIKPFAVDMTAWEIQEYLRMYPKEVLLVHTPAEEGEIKVIDWKHPLFKISKEDLMREDTIRPPDQRLRIIKGEWVNIGDVKLEEDKL